MDQPRIEHLHQFDQVPDAVNVRGQRVVERRRELHQARRVDQEVDLARQFGELFGRKAAHRAAKVSFDNRRSFEDGIHAESFDDGLKRRRPQYFGTEAFRARNVLPGANLDHQVFEFGKPVQHHRQQHLADESSGAEHEHRPAVEQVDRRNLTRAASIVPRFGAVFTGDGIEIPVCQGAHGSSGVRYGSIASRTVWETIVYPSPVGCVPSDCM